MVFFRCGKHPFRGERWIFSRNHPMIPCDEGRRGSWKPWTMAWLPWSIKHRIPRIGNDRKGSISVHIYISWLLVSKMTFIFHNIWDVILPIDYFSR